MKTKMNTLLGKAFGICMAFVAAFGMFTPITAYAVEDNSSAMEDSVNTFVGTVNGEDIIGYLDVTYAYYLGGKDYNACFVTFDESGAPKYEIYIRIDEDVPVGTYSDAEKHDKDKVFLFVYTAFDETTQQFKDSYTFRDSNKSWTMELTNAEYSDNGVFEGTLEGICMPYAFNDSPSYTEVEISGAFHFQMQTLHPTMETYRSEHPTYDSAHEVSYVQTLGTPAINFSTGDEPAFPDTNFKVDHTCRTCHGTGLCQRCHGLGETKNPYDFKVRDCVRCQGSGICTVCYGTGKIY